MKLFLIKIIKKVTSKFHISLLEIKMHKQNLLPYLLLLIQPIFMASNLIVARGGVEFVPPISLAFWRWFFVFSILLPFTFLPLRKI